MFTTFQHMCSFMEQVACKTYCIFPNLICTLILKCQIQEDLYMSDVQNSLDNFINTVQIY